MLELLRNLSDDQANTYGLVLSSSGIAYHVRKDWRGWKIWINDADYERALDTVKLYFEENRGEFATPSEPAASGNLKTFSGLWVIILMLSCYLAANSGQSRHLIDVFGSSADRIMGGELYRTVTALFFHAGPLHLIGNLVGIGIFGTVVSSIAGWGAGWLMILLSGVMGNLANALFYQTGHLSVGASTAVFGAVGILAAIQFFRKYRFRGERAKAWLPLGGGLALLALMGVGQYADVTAHLFGFVSGILLGLFYEIKISRPPSRFYQLCCLGLMICILLSSWASGLSHR